LPVGQMNLLCLPCHRAVQADDRRRRARDTTRLCPDCNQPVGEPRTTARCRECHRKKVLAVRTRPGRVCAMCGQPNRTRQGYCRTCKCVYNHWYQAYKRGDPGARALRPLRPYTRYKEANP
jgi:hypothetical protein